MESEDLEQELALSEMHVDEIEELLVELGAEMSDEELHQTALFMKQLGSLEAALAAIEQIGREAA